MSQRPKEHRVRAAFRKNFSTDNPRGQAAIASAVLFLVAPSLALFVSTWFLLLVIPAAILSVVGLGSLSGSQSASRLAATGTVMAFNGATLMIALFLAGFISDFVVGGRSPHQTEAVAFGYTTVHIMLGAGLLLVDNYRHSRTD
jgi:hypothetical protein